jgi:hypothetical protein
MSIRSGDLETSNKMYSGLSLAGLETITLWGSIKSQIYEVKMWNRDNFLLNMYIKLCYNVWQCCYVEVCSC